MSYSYVKTVFPDFKYSNVYDTKLYENLNVSQHDTKLFEPADLDINKSYSSIAILESLKESLKEAPKENSKIETFQDNHKFFNQPLPSNNIPIDNNIIKKEKFDGETKSQGHHTEYTKHILECGPCKELLMKQFGLENERIRNEEIMELISYLIFGLFILLLIDTYAKK
jgi:hypothetical protein